MFRVGHAVVVVAASAVALHTNAAPVPWRVGPGHNRLTIFRGNELRVIDPEGKREEPFPRLDSATQKWSPLYNSVKVSPDGKHVVWQVRPSLGQSDEVGLYIRGWWDSGRGTQLAVPWWNYWWAGNDHLLFRQKRHADDPVKFIRYHIATGRTEDVKLPPDLSPVEFTPDGKRLLAFQAIEDGNGERSDWSLYDLKGGKEPLVIDESPSRRTFSVCLSPDSQKVAFVVRVDKRPDGPATEPRVGFYVMSLKDRKPVRIDGFRGAEDWDGPCWSPDGKRLAYSWYVRQKGVGIRDGGIVVLNADGTNRTTIARPRKTGAVCETLHVHEWR
jgi:WD40 repeat protein